MDPSADTTIRPIVPTDFAPVREINRAAFGGSEEADLVDRLRNDGDAVAELVAAARDRIVGHILFSRLSIDGAAGTVPAAALAPVAVEPSFQRRGVGSALIRQGLEACRARAIAAVIVLGHPAYYPRFGFSAAAVRHLEAPFSGAAFMALELTPGALRAAGTVRYPAAFGI